MSLPSTPQTPETASPSIARQVLNVAMTFAAMSGWRLNQLNVPWVVLGIASLAFGQYVITRNELAFTIPFFIFTLIFYYGGNTVIFTSGWNKWAIERYGEERGYRLYQTILALMFINQGLGVGAMSALSIGTSLVLPISPTVAWAVGGVMFAIGLVVKVWATVVVGVDIYYYKDMFLGRPVSAFVSSGPYKVFPNPMYGIGQIHGYGYAIINRSLGGLIAIAICHALIYAFYYTAEAPFVKRTYLTPAAA